MDTTLKQRLIGAVVLVALAVIFLPMLVQGPAPDSGVADVSTRVPDAPGGEYETRELPMLSAPGDAQPASVAAAPQPASEAPAPTPAQPAPADPAVAAGRWAVSFGAYASSRDADAVLSRLRQAGLEGFSEQATLNGRQAWRVRVGPYDDRAQAEAGRLQAVRIRNDVNAQVIALDAGNAAAPAQASPAPAATTAAVSTPTPAPASAAAETTPLRPEPQASAPASTTRTATTATPPPATRPAATPPRPAEAPKPAPAASTPAPTQAPAATSIGFAVQMGAFASTAEANALRDRLRSGGFSAIVQPVRTDKGTLNRVRVGPVSSRAEADQLKARLAAGSFGAGIVVSHP
ncbi:SPOR domain-containing protein [Xanthomonas sp. XNM01]|uniref:SPOR domain-containing protein n=1 Tax=Xanthomonas sp. XNM01 TaxID=2769289 RepID=UPI00177DF156|nr:SPOR domain-containing protein [Xanthomonas sp. XNM01]